MDYENNNERMSAYAKSAIGGCVLLNSGALIAIMSQLPDVAKHLDHENLRCALMAWTVGVCVGTLAWLFAFMSIASFGHGLPGRESLFTVLGLLSVVSAVFLFGYGMWNVASGIQPLPTP